MGTLSVDELAKKYQGFLQEEGYGCKGPTKDEEANTLDLVVKYEGLNLLIVLDYDDSDFVRVLLPNFYDVTADTLLNALQAVNEVASKCKGAKVYLNSKADDTHASVEFLENGNSLDKDLLLRYCAMLVNAAKVYASKMKELGS